MGQVLQRRLGDAGLLRDEGGLAVGECRLDECDVLRDDRAAVHPAQDAALVEGVEVAADRFRRDVEPCREVGD